MSEENTSTANDQLVGVGGNIITVMMPQTRMTTNAALRHAAWLVALAQTQDDYEEGAWERQLEAVQNA